MRNESDRIERDLFIDALRVMSVLIVVFGHWLTTTVIWEEGRIEAENALSTIRQTHLATWFIQVMPLMFFVGGFSNARSIDRHGGEYLAYLRTRYERLLRPTIVFIALWLVVGVAGEVLGLSLPNVLDRAADQAALPFWFLGLYLIVVALAHPMRALHRRFNWYIPGVMVVGTLLVDVLHHQVGIRHVGIFNYAFVWLLAHQFGFFYAEGSLQRLPRRLFAGMATTGLAGMALLTSVAGYPVSMVGVPGDERWNTNPPSLALVMLTLWMVGLAMLLRPALLKASTAPRPRRWVAGFNRVVLTVFLWHVSALSLTASIIYPLGFARPEAGTAKWWALRPLWLASLVPVLVALVGVFRRFETHPTARALPIGDAPRTRHVAAGLAVTSLGLGILGFGVTGFNQVTAVLGEDVLGFEMNPLQNVLHVGVGLALLLAVRQSANLVTLAATTAAATYLALGLAGGSNGIKVLGMNSASAALHVGVSIIAATLLAWAVWSDRRAGRI